MLAKGPLVGSDAVHVLLVEDDDELAALLGEYLAQHHFAVTRAASGEEGVRRILRAQPDLVILDLMLPDLTGLEVCQKVRPQFGGPIVMLTASQSEVDHVMSLELGADDFVSKPVDPRILLARIRARLRPRHWQEFEQTLELGSLRIDISSRAAHIDGCPVPLTTMEFDVLVMLARAAGTVVKRDDLYQAILETEYDGLDRGMDVHVSRIRKKLAGLGFDPNRLESVRGVGYLLTKT